MAASITAAYVGELTELPTAANLAQINDDKPIFHYRTADPDYKIVRDMCAPDALSILERLTQLTGEKYQLVILSFTAAGMCEVDHFPNGDSAKTIYLCDSNQGETPLVHWSGFMSRTQYDWDMMLEDDYSLFLTPDDDMDMGEAAGQGNDAEPLMATGNQGEFAQGQKRSADSDESIEDDQVSDEGHRSKRVRHRTKEGIKEAYTFRLKGVDSAPPVDTHLPLDLMEGITLDELLVFFPNHAVHWPAITMLTGLSGRAYASLQKSICLCRQSRAEYDEQPLVLANTIGQSIIKGINSHLGQTIWDKNALVYAQYAGIFWKQPDFVKKLEEAWSLSQIGAFWKDLPNGPPGQGMFRDRVAAALRDPLQDAYSDADARILANPPTISAKWNVPDTTLPNVARIKKAPKARPSSSNVTTLHRNHPKGQFKDMTNVTGVDYDALRDAIRADPLSEVRKYHGDLVGEILLTFLSVLKIKDLAELVERVLTELNVDLGLLGKTLHTLPDRTMYTHRKRRAFEERAKLSLRTVAEEVADWETTHKPGEKTAARPQNGLHQHKRLGTSPRPRQPRKVAGASTGSPDAEDLERPSRPARRTPVTPPPAPPAPPPAGYQAAVATGSHQQEPVDDSFFDSLIRTSLLGAIGDAELAPPVNEELSAMDTSPDEFQDLFEEDSE